MITKGISESTVRLVADRVAIPEPSRELRHLVQMTDRVLR
jgi:hypothetical protein